MIKNIIIVSIFSFVLLSILGCGEEGLIDPHDEVEFSPPLSTGLQASEFPTNNGSAWTYVSPGLRLYNPGEDIDILGLIRETFTIRIEGVRDISGITHRRATVSEISGSVLTASGEETSGYRIPVDHLTANALYYRFNFDFGDIDLPIGGTYFIKTPRAYTESAFDVFNSSVPPQKHFPPRLLWDFPLQTGKEWIVFETKTLPVRRVVRRVIAANVSVVVPAGSFSNAYLVEEEIVGLSALPARKISDDFQEWKDAKYEPAKYWVVPNVGVVKHQYTYLLTKRELPDGTEANPLFSGDFELSQFELPDDHSR